MSSAESGKPKRNKQKRDDPAFITEKPQKKSKKAGEKPSDSNSTPIVSAPFSDLVHARNTLGNFPVDDEDEEIDEEVLKLLEEHCPTSEMQDSSHEEAIAQPVTLAKSQSTSPEAPNKVVAPQKTVLTVPPPASPAPAAPASMPETPTTRSDSKKKGGRSSPNFSLEETHYLLSLIEKYGALNQNDYEVIVTEMEAKGYPKRNASAYLKRFNKLRQGLSTGGGSHPLTVKCRNIYNKVVNMKAGVFGENPYKVEESRTMETVGPTADPSLNERSNATLNSQMNAVQNNGVSETDDSDRKRRRAIKPLPNQNEESISSMFLAMMSDSRNRQEIEQKKYEMELHKMEIEKMRHEKEMELMKQKHDMQMQMFFFQHGHINPQMNSTNSTTEQRINSVEQEVGRLNVEIARINSDVTNKLDEIMKFMKKGEEK